MHRLSAVPLRLRGLRQGLSASALWAGVALVACQQGPSRPAAEPSTASDSTASAAPSSHAAVAERASPPALGASAARGVVPAQDAVPAQGAKARSDADASSVALQEPSPPALPLPAGTRVLHVGDSFAGALGLALNRRFEAAGVKGILKYQTASYIPGWAHGKELPRHLATYRPDLVLVTLGANELEIVEPEQRVKAIEKLIATLGGRPCVWIATPLWAGAKNGLMDIIRAHSAPCLYLDTNALIPEMARVADGIHPSPEAREQWAEVVIEWLRTHRQPTPTAPGEPARPWTLRP